jgi:hypothetical protein
VWPGFSVQVEVYEEDGRYWQESEYKGTRYVRRRKDEQERTVTCNREHVFIAVGYQGGNLQHRRDII